MMTYSVLIPARRTTTWGALAAVAFQTVPPDEVIILDQAEAPLTRQYEFRMVLDILTEKDIRVIYLRSQDVGLRAARLRLGDAAQGEVLAWIDDDLLLEPGSAQRCLDALAARPKEWAAVCRCPTPNNEYDSAIWEPPSQAPSEFYFGDKRPEYSHTLIAGLNATFLRAAIWPKARKVFLRPGDRPGDEDRDLWSEIGPALVVPGAYGWEMKHQQQRAFPPYVESLSE